MAEPDWLDFTGSKADLCLLTDDGSPTTPKLAQTLLEQGLSVAVLSFPEPFVTSRLPLPAGVSRIELSDLSEDHLQQKLAVLSTTFGKIQTLIHLHPHFPLEQTAEIAYLEQDKMIVQHVFLLAKYLKHSLCEVRAGRNSFLTATRLDGAFGMGQCRRFSPIGAGLFGLTKSLNHEWPTVFCRGIDLSPELNPEQSVAAILAELHAPDLDILEVAYGPQGRSTLACEPI